MNNRERFFEAFAHTAHRVMGRALFPFSLRHRFWLEALASPLVNGGRVNWLDLELASRICAIPFERLDMEVPRMVSRKPWLWEKLVFTWRVWRGGTAEREYGRLLEYLIDYGCPPATHTRSAKTSGGKSYETLPGLLSLVTALARGSGWSPEDIWALNPGAAEWYLAGISLHRGIDLKVKTEHDEEFEEGMRREMERKKQGASNQSPETN